MTQRDDHWETEDDEVVRRLRDGKPRLSAFELDRVKTMVIARVRRSSSRRPSTSRRATPRLSLLVALLTFGAMVAGTAGTIAAGNSSLSSPTGAAQSQYRPPKCNPRHEECTCPGGSVRQSRDACACPSGSVFAAGTNDCRVPCPDGGTRVSSGLCLCPDNGHEEFGKCVHKHPVPAALTPSTASPPGTPSTASAAPGATTGTSASAATSVTPVSVSDTSTPAAVVRSTTHTRTRHTRTRHLAGRLAHSRKARAAHTR
jgi:hypothetical protein